MSFEAKYPGICANCEERFPAGAEITYDDGEIVHTGCVGVETPEPVAVAPCPKCFLAHVGECL